MNLVIRLLLWSAILLNFAAIAVADGDMINLVAVMGTSALLFLDVVMFR